MRGMVYALGSALAIALVAPAWGGEVYVIETSQGSKPIAVKKDTSALAAVPTMADGKSNQGFSYASLYELPGAGIRVMRGHIDPKGSVAVHDGASQYILYVIAGTGKLTRLLVPSGARVIAVEPLAEMRAVLEQAVPAAEVLDATAESLPLADASVDAVTVAQAFHWFDAERALAEIARIVRPGGALS